MWHLKNNKGSALMVTIILLMIVTVLGVAMLFSAVNEIQLNKVMEENITATYLSQAGIEHGLYLIDKKYQSLNFPYYKEFVIKDRSRMYTISINKAGADTTISSTGIIEIDGVIKQQVNMQAIVQEDGQVIIQK